MTIWLRSSQGSLRDLARVRIGGSCGDPDGFLSKRSLRDPVHFLVRSSCGDSGQILFKMSLHEDLAETMP